MSRPSSGRHGLFASVGVHRRGRSLSKRSAARRDLVLVSATPGLVGAIALADDVVVAVKGGRDAGLIAFEHDPEGALLDEPSPAELDLPATLGRLGIAAAIAVVVVLLPGLIARRRFVGPIGAGSDDELVEEDA